MSSSDTQNVRARARRFDWDRARERREAGEPVTQIAASYGVTVDAIYRVTSPGLLERNRAVAREHSAQRNTGAANCSDCGTPISRITAVYGKGRCHPCSREVTTVRETELYCPGCKQWHPDAAFPPASRSKPEPRRRGRRRYCRTCSNEQRRSYRHRTGR